MTEPGLQQEAEQAWEAHYERIYPKGVFSDPYMKSDGRPAFIAAKKAGFICGWEEATESRARRIRELEIAVCACHQRAEQLRGLLWEGLEAVDNGNRTNLESWYFKAKPHA